MTSGSPTTGSSTSLRRPNCCQPPPPPPLGADFGQRLRDWLRFLSSIHHRALVMLYDFGVGPGHALFILMQHVPGHSLARILAASRRVGLEQAMSIVAGIACPLAAVHAAGGVHGELWPGSVLVRSDGMVMLSLFGLARQYGLPRPGSVLTAERVRYLSPEQLTEREAQAPSDVYALGVIAYHCLAGHLPFDGQDPSGTVPRGIWTGSGVLYPSRRSGVRSIAKILAWLNLLG